MWRVLVVFTLILPAFPQTRRIAPPGNGKRVALVVGNNEYPGAKLKNAENDATGMRDVLSRFGFTVELALNLNLEAFERTVDAFADRLSKGDVALFYYSGHGIQLQEQNYLVPVDFNAKDATSAKYRSYPVNLVMERLADRGVTLQVVILDACRDNPFRGLKSLSRGFAAVNAGKGMYVAFATAPGQTASDNPDGRNGLFTGELITELSSGGTLDEVFNRVRARVSERSGGSQTPWSTSSVIGEFRFDAPLNSFCSKAWALVEGAHTIPVLEQYLAESSGCPEAALARIELAKLRAASEQTRPEVKPVASFDEGRVAYDAKDYAKALLIFGPLAQQGDARSEFYIGFMYVNGLGVARDEGEAVRWYRQSAEQGDALAQSSLGFMYEKGRGGLTKDSSEAVRWYRKAAENGSANGQHNLGVMYRDGTGVTRDAADAVRWFRKAADQGYAFGQNDLGVLYRDGTGVTQDFAEAVRWFRKAAEQGEALGLFNLGTCYELGNGVAKDEAEALRLFESAAAKGYEPAKPRADALRKRIQPGSR